MKIALVATRGGHLSEIVQLVPALGEHEFFFVAPHSPRDAEIEALGPVFYSLSIDARITRFIPVFFWALGVLLKQRPDVVLSMGTEIALPFFFWGRLLGMKTIYIESWCRVENLSLTGRLVYHWVHEFWVQWPRLQERFAKAKFRGAIL
jgi:beta-1,4-N-acetylglucosaminyltransferase